MARPVDRLGNLGRMPRLVMTPSKTCRRNHEPPA